MNNAKRVVKNTGILYAKMGLTIFISLYTTRLLLDALGTEDYGIFNIVAGTVALLTFLNTAMTSATQRFMSHAEGAGEISKKKNIFNISILIHCILAILIAIFIEVIGGILFEYVLIIPENRFEVAIVIFHFTVLSTVFSILTVPFDAVINAHENMLFFSIVSLIDVLLRFAAAIFITYTQSDRLIVFGVSFTIVKALILILYFVYCKNKYKECVIDPIKYFDKALFNKMTSFAGYSFLTSASSIITMQGMSILLNSFFGVAVNAAQGISTQISGQLMAFSTTMLKALNPVIVKNEGGNQRIAMIKSSMIGNKYSNYLVSLFAIPVLIETPYILSVWLVDVPDYAIIFCRLNIFRLTISQLTITFPTAIGATGNIRNSSFVESALYISLIPSSYVAFKLGATPEIIYINLILMVLGLSISRTYFVIKQCNMLLSNFIKEVVAPSFFIFIISFILGVIPTLILDSGAVRLVTVVSVCCSVYLTSVYNFGMVKVEKELLKSMIMNLINKLKSSHL